MVTIDVAGIAYYNEDSAPINVIQKMMIKSIKKKLMLVDGISNYDIKLKCIGDKNVQLIMQDNVPEEIKERIKLASSL